MRDGEERARKVRNRDIPALARVSAAMKEIVMVQQRMDWQRDRIMSTTSRVTGMPRGGEDHGFDEAIGILEELEKEQVKRWRTYARELGEAERALSSIKSRTLEAFVRCVYLNQRGKAEVMAELHMSEWGYRQAREAVERARDMKSVVWNEKYIVEEAGPLDSQGEM